MQILEWCKAILYGILEGITEWLPVSSTGHLILFGERLPFRFTADAGLLAEFEEMFEVVIQLGAICAVLVLYWNRLVPMKKTKAERIQIRRLWGRVCIASLPAAVVGILVDRVILSLTGRDLDGWLYHAPVVAVALIVYGVAFLLPERFFGTRVTQIDSTDRISNRQAMGVGLFQALSLIPGTSRSGSTILGARLMGLSRNEGTEFSFFMAIPVMLGAGGIKMLGFLQYVAETGVTVPVDAWIILAIGCAVSFGVSMIAIRFLTDFVKRHSFAPFGIYRILLGAAVLAWG